MESFLWRNDPSQSISDLDWFIRRPEQFSNCCNSDHSLKQAFVVKVAVFVNELWYLFCYQLLTTPLH